MKYCRECGNPMEDEMLFCRECGTKAAEQSLEESEKEDTNESYIQEGEESKVTQSATSDPFGIHNENEKSTAQIGINKPRKGMKILSIIFFSLAGLNLLMVFINSVFLVQMAFWGILGIMFLILSKSPKESPFILGKTSGIKKPLFIIVCVCGILLSSSLLGIVSVSSESDAGSTDQAISEEEASGDAQKTEADIDEEKEDKTKSLSDVEKWYEDQMPKVSQSLLEYSKSVDGLTNMNVTESKFRFGEESGWYDCHYTFYFTCKVNGDLCSGEARAFMKYGDGAEEIDWFHFEIFREADYATIVEHYDDSYDQIIEDYYKELEAQYK